MGKVLHIDCRLTRPVRQTDRLIFTSPPTASTLLGFKLKLALTPFPPVPTTTFFGSKDKFMLYCARTVDWYWQTKSLERSGGPGLLRYMVVDWHSSSCAKGLKPAVCMHSSANGMSRLVLRSATTLLMPYRGRVVTQVLNRRPKNGQKPKNASNMINPRRM